MTQWHGRFIGTGYVLLLRVCRRRYVRQVGVHCTEVRYTRGEIHVRSVIHICGGCVDRLAVGAREHAGTRECPGIGNL